MSPRFLFILIATIASKEVFSKPQDDVGVTNADPGNGEVPPEVETVAPSPSSEGAQSNPISPNPSPASSPTSFSNFSPSQTGTTSPQGPNNPPIQQYPSSNQLNTSPPFNFQIPLPGQGFGQNQHKQATIRFVPFGALMLAQLAAAQQQANNQHFQHGR